MIGVSATASRLVVPPDPPAVDVEGVLAQAEHVGIRDLLAAVLTGERRDAQQARRG